MITKKTRRYGKREQWLENFADELKANPTKSESLIRQYLEDGVSGCKFIFQVPMLGYIPDFLCEEHKLIIEIDGKIHRGSQQKKDRTKDQVYKTYGYRVLRIKDKDILANIDYVIEDVIDWIKQKPTKEKQETKPKLEKTKSKKLDSLPIPKFEGDLNPLRNRVKKI